MRGTRDDENNRYSLDNLEAGFHKGVTYVASAVHFGTFFGLFALLFGVFRVIPFREAVLWTYAIANVMAFIAVTWDKAKARSFQWRISEALLHLLEAFGGFGGSFLAQHLFRHKIRKATYQIVFWVIVAIHIGFWIWWFKYGVDWMETIRQKQGLRR